MSYCYFCHWGWPPEIAAIYTRAKEALGGDEHPLHYGPAHAVWEDENFDAAECCIENFDRYVQDTDPDLTGHEKAVVMQSLVELAALPMELRVPPESFNWDDLPSDHPPPWRGVKL